MWVGRLSQHNRRVLRGAQRIVATRAVRGYRTIAGAAACVLAGTPPWELEAEVLAEVYRYRTEARTRGQYPGIKEMRRVRKRAQESLVPRWEAYLEDAEYGTRTIEAILPILTSWIDRRHGSLTFRLVQVLTGHGCFGRYLHKIAKREETPSCHECGAEEDTAQHTLEVCPFWAPQRRTLVTAIGENLSLPCVVEAMLGSNRSWEAMVSFCEDVMSQNEAAERVRENAADADPIRRRRLGRRRQRFARLLQL